MVCTKRYSWHLSEDPRFDFNSSVAKPIIRTDKLRPPPPFRLQVEEVHLCNVEEIHLCNVWTNILVLRFTLGFGALSSPDPLSTFFYDIRFQLAIAMNCVFIEIVMVLHTYNSLGGFALPSLGRRLIYAGGACCTNASKVSIKETFALIVTHLVMIPHRLSPKTLLMALVFSRIVNCERLAGGQWRVTQKLGGSGTGRLHCWYRKDEIRILFFHRFNLSG